MIPAMRQGVVLGVLLAVAACSAEPTAPDGAGLCWRMIEHPDKRPGFEILARDVPNLESCAVQLEGVRLMQGSVTAGAYNGHFIFATEAQITSSQTLSGARVRVFEAEDLEKVREALGALIEQQRADGAAPVRIPGLTAPADQ